MSLEKLLKKIEKDAEEEIESLKKEHALEIEKIEKEGRKRIQDVKKEKEEKIEKEKERSLEDYEKEKEFLLNMDLLKTKKDLLEEAVNACKEDIGKFSLAEKKKLLKKKVESIKDFLGEKSLVFVAQGKKKDYADIFEGVPGKNIVERKGVADDELVVEGKDFIFKASLCEMVDEVVKDEEGSLAKVLFKQ